VFIVDVKRLLSFLGSESIFIYDSLDDDCGDELEIASSTFGEGLLATT
jgi:hypothetical protein